ncbi:RAM signaling network component [Podila minutissima]|uniref:RAM signaling network component n=1 Tax=Podila minutissima TaxID=64525 RepID=A0A9P5VKP1_9FUNG|nr:RAM signaling network component [Podila minutissima]
MSQGDDGAAGAGGPNAMVGEETGGATSLMSLIHQRQDAAGSTQTLDLSYANLDVFPTEIEFLREVLEKLTMSHNSIRTLPLQLNMFTSLRYLNIRSNSIRIFPAVLCHLSSLEILDMSRNRIARFPDSFGNLMHLRVLSLSRNRIEVIPAYVGDMAQLQFLKIEQNPLTFPPSDIVDHSGEDMEGWLSRLKAFLSSHGTHDSQSKGAIQVEDGSATPTPTLQGPPLHQRTMRSTSSDSLVIPPTHRQSKSEPGLRLSIPNSNDRSVSRSAALSPEPTTHKVARVNSQHVNHNDDHYRFISHSRGVSGDSTSSFGSTTSNDGDKYSDVYFQRLASQPSLPNPLPSDKLRLVEAARGILFALSQIYRAVKQCVGCVTEEKLGLLFSRLLQNTSSSITQLILALDRFDSTAHTQVPDQNTCSEILRNCESNVVAFRKLVNMVQTQIRAISLAADARLVRNLVLQLHGALSEIRLAWDALVPLIQAASGESSTALVDPNHTHKDNKDHQPILQHSVLLSSSHHGHHQSHPFHHSPTMQATPTWHPIQMPQRSQNMSRTSNHSNHSVTNPHADEDEDTQLLLTVEHAIEAARRLIQSLTETCVTRFESHLNSPQLRPTHRNRSVSASPPRSSGSSGSSHSSGHNNSSSNGSNGSAKTVQDEQGRSLTMSPLQLSTDTSGSGAPSSAATSTSTSDSNPTLILSPLFSNSADCVPYSNGMCLSLPIDKGPNVMKTTTTTTTTTTTETPATTPNTGSTTSAGQNENSVPRAERRSTTGSHSKGPSRTYDPALPSIPQNEAPESGPSPKSQVSSTTPGGMVVTSRSASVSVGSSGGYVSSNHGTLSSSSLPSQGFLSGQGPHPHFQSSHPPSHLQPGTPGQYSSSPIAYPFVAGNTLNLPASQLWREMRDCLLQMTEIVKRLDLDLTMIRTEDHHPLHHHHQNHLNQHHVHHSAYHHPHHHTHGREGPHPYQHGVPPHNLSVPSESDSNALRRRFGMGISDFVKSVVVISTLVRQLSSTGPRSGAGSGGTGSFIMGPGDLSTTISTTTTTTTTTVSMSATPRVGSAGSGESNHLSPVTGSSNGLMPESSPESKVSSTSMSASSSTTGLALTASPEKAVGSSSYGQQPSHPPSHPYQHPLTRYQSQTSLLLAQQHKDQQQQQQPEIFSRLVTTNVSNLTKITKELTMRMPRSSFRDLMLPQSSPSAHPIITSSSSTSLSSSGGGAMGGGGSMMSHTNSFAGAGIGSGATSSLNGGLGGYGSGSGYSYGPAGASILALRKGSLI